MREVLTKLYVDGLALDASEHSDLDLPDPDAEPLLAVASAASSDFLVTGDLSDYPPDKRRGYAVVSPAVFMEHWRNLQPED